MATWSRKCTGMTQEEVDALHMKIAMKQEQHLIPLKEDLADWLNKTLEVEDITASNFMDKLDNGVIICKLARLIQQKAEECKRRGLITEPVPSVRFKCWENAKSESFYARDNADNFIRWCRKFGVHEAVIFESDGLVLHTQPRTVVLCLLELGRIASKFDIEPPGLVQLEKEIDAQEDDRSSDGLSPLSTGSSSPNLVRSRTESALSLGSTRSLLTSPDSGIDPIHNMRPRNRLSYTPPSSVETKKHKPSELDKKVMKIANNVCKDQTQITRISEGKYCIGGKNVFVRLLKGRHVMVRVGGGWDTLEHFLSRHEPCQVIVVNRKNSLSDEYISLACNGSPDSFLHIRAKYKSPLPTPTTPEFKVI
ncbi:growth arrest-specific protein 2 [Trichonephila clavata]|uniref:Growth arrest-specific protein 2 n=2 Tax=Nephilidae TaxID=450948 RepID=A0A8X6FT49_TRICU|nr:growth arrest-specific protein 2 [Trichonephila clavata]GFT11632.1 growth arrest-specific protein 2 [Nephila pilipes]